MILFEDKIKPHTKM